MPGTILSIDDNPFIRKTFRRILEREGYEVREADNAHEGLKELRRKNIDVVLLDVMMPGRSGVDCLADIKREFPNVPVIMISGVKDIGTGVEAMKRGALDYLVKPANRDELLGTVQKAMVERLILRELERSVESIRPEETFTINHVLLMDERGEIILHKILNSRVKLDKAIFGSMFTAIRMFIDRSLSIKGDTNYIKQGDYAILIEGGDGYYLAVVGEGEEDYVVRERMRKTVRKLDGRWRKDRNEDRLTDEIFSELIGW